MLRRCATPFVLLVALAAAIELYGCTPVDGAMSEGDGGSPCEQLRLKACGAIDECLTQGWCEAAKLLAEVDTTGERCTKALTDEASYPACNAQQLANGACDQLVDLTCGVAKDGGTIRPCAGDSSCVNAKLLASRPDAGNVDAAAREPRCQAALYETSLYPACQR